MRIQIIGILDFSKGLRLSGTQVKETLKITTASAFRGLFYSLRVEVQRKLSAEAEAAVAMGEAEDHL